VNADNRASIDKGEWARVGSRGTEGGLHLRALPADLAKPSRALPAAL
jgi:hypothetical protein